MATTTFTAIADPPEIAAANPIHGDAGKDFGYDGAIVAGISSYGWAATAILEELGDGWLESGWSETQYRSAVYAGDPLTSTVEPLDDSQWSIEQHNADGTVTVAGTCGLGRAPWADDFDLPTQRTPEPALTALPRLGPDDVPSHVDYRAMELDVTRQSAVDWAQTRLGDHDGKWADGERPSVHPSWVPGQMTPLIRHSHRFGIGVHASGRIQHLAPLRAGERIIVAGRWTDSELKKGRRWSTTDAVFLDESGTELAYCRQVAVFLS